MSVKKIAVIGAGNGGHVMAAHKTLDGFEVSLFELPRFADNVRQVLDTGQITVEWPERKETVKIHQATTDIATSMDSAFGSGSIQVGRKMRGPSSIQDRYITEDVPYGLVFLSTLGCLLEVTTPVSDAIVNSCGAINRADYWHQGRGVKDLGLDGMNLERLKIFLETGE